MRCAGELTPPEPGSDPVRLVAPIIVDGPLAFVAARIPTRSDIFAIDTAGQVVWSAAPGGPVSALAADSANGILYAASILPLTNQGNIPLLTGYTEADGLVHSAVVAEVRGFVPVDSLAFSNGLVFGTQSDDHGEGGVGAFASHPDSGALAWSGDGQVTTVTRARWSITTSTCLTPSAGHLYAQSATRLYVLAPT